MTPSASGAVGSPLRVPFPSDDESCGCVSIAWRGPAYEERGTWSKLQLLWTYLTDSAASPLQKAFVECDDALCADVSPAQEVFTRGYHQLWLTEAALETIDEIIPKFFVEARAAADTFDLEQMRQVKILLHVECGEYNFCRGAVL